MSPEDLLSLSLSQPLPTDHYTSLPRFLDVEEPVTRAITPGTSGESAGSEGKKKAKKKKRKGSSVEVSMATKKDEADMTVMDPMLQGKPSMCVDREPGREYVHQVMEAGESDGEIQKESIIVNPWIPPPPVSPTKLSIHSNRAPSRPATPPLPNIPNQSPTSTPRRATPMQCQRPRATILSEYPLLSQIPSMIPTMPTIGDVRAAGRVTRDAGVALVGTVRDEYARRMKEKVTGRANERKEPTQRRTRHRRRESMPDSSGESSGSQNVEEDSSDAEVLVDVEDAEGMAETSWRGVGPDEAALGLGWLKWRSCRWERYRDRRLLISINPTPQTAVQITNCSSLAVQPSPMHMLHPETIDMGNSAILQTAPFETLHIPRHRPGKAEAEANALACENVEVMDGVVDKNPPPAEGDEEVLVDCAMLRPVEGSLRWLFLTNLKRSAKLHAYGQGADPGIFQVYLSVFDMRTRRVERKMLLGYGTGGQVVSSPVAIVVALAGETPSIHFLSPETLRPIRRPITSNIAANTRTGLPVISLNGRFFAYTSTDKRPAQPIQRGSQEQKLGTIVTVASNQAFHSRANGNPRKKPAPGSPFRPETLQTASSPTMQSIVLNTAAGLSSEVAKGMWTGLKGLGAAAIQGASQSETLSKSAPVLSSLAQRYHLPTNDIRGREKPAEGTPAREPQHQSRFTGGAWVKVLDLKAAGSILAQQQAYKNSDRKLEKAKQLAHFALPATEVISVPHTVGSPTIDVLSFSPDGTSLALGTSDGRSSFIVEIRPAGTRAKPLTADGEPDGEVWVRCELRRGMTPAVVETIEWSACGSWIGIGSRRTIHVFAIHPAGGRVSPQQIKTGRLMNAERLSPLCVKVYPVLRIRRPRGILIPSAKASAPSSPSKALAGDTVGRTESPACRVPARSFFFGPPVVDETDGKKTDTSHGVLRSLNVFDPIKRILRSEAIYTSHDATRRSSIAPAKPDDLRLASSIFRAWKVPTEPYPLFVGEDVLALKYMDRRAKTVPFANAEIRTYSTSPHILPRPIYRENWIRFTSIRHDDYGLPTEYKYRVTVDAIVPGHGPGIDLLRPLARAVETQMDFQFSMPMIPALPNGAGREPSLWHASFSTFANARDIVRMRRKDSNLTSVSATSGASPASFGEQVIARADAGAIFDVGTGGVAGNEPDDMTNGSTSGDTRDDEWDDDLVTGVMDDESHHGAYATPGLDAANGHQQNGFAK